MADVKVPRDERPARHGPRPASSTTSSPSGGTCTGTPSPRGASSTTTARVCEGVERVGVDALYVGRDAPDDVRSAVPDDDEMEAWYERALADGADEASIPIAVELLSQAVRRLAEERPPERGTRSGERHRTRERKRVTAPVGEDSDVRPRAGPVTAPGGIWHRRLVARAGAR